MVNKLTTILRKVFLGSLAGIAASNVSATDFNNERYQPIEEDNKVESPYNKKKDLSLKLILKKTENNEWLYMSHRSHRSHSSHRSHMSHFSSSSTFENPSPSSTSSASSSLRTTNNETASYSLGSRTLRRGMKGTDVTELVNILINKKYLTLDDGKSRVSGSYTFDKTVEDAVKSFQSDVGLDNDGVCGPTTFYYLKN